MILEGGLAGLEGALEPGLEGLEVELWVVWLGPNVVVLGLVGRCGARCSSFWSRSGVDW